MKFSKKNLKISTIALILVLAISATLVAIPIVSSQPGTTWKTWAICEVVPNEIGVNQPVLVVMGLTRQTIWPQAGWVDVQVTVTKPDGSTETITRDTDTTGMTGATYVPTMQGVYTFQTNFPEQVLNVDAAGVEAGTTMLASDSAIISLTVTAEARPYFPETPLPDYYWTRPIDSQNREWDGIAGSWLDGSLMRTTLQRNAPNNDGPETAHILWDKPFAEGGLVGGFNQLGFETGDAYEGKWGNPVIVAGILVSNRHTRGTQETFAIDVRTGEELWSEHLGDSVDFGQLMYWDTMNMHGSFAYIWTTQGSTWRAWDPLTGRNEYNMTNVPGGTRVMGPNGEIMRYSISTNSDTISIWNSTAAFYQRQLILDGNAANPAYPAGRWRPIGQEFDAGNGTQYTGTLSEDVSGSVEVVIAGYRAIGSNTQWSGSYPEQNPQFFAIDLRPGHIGDVIFNKAWTIPEQGLHVDFTGSHPYSVEYDVFVVTAKETRLHYGISMTTGEQLWATTHFEPYMNSFANLYMDPWGQAVCAEDKLITAGFGGVVNAYSLVDGTHIWEYALTDYNSEFLFSNAWSCPTGFITDGKIYLFHMEHSVIQPMPRGAPTACISLDTGDEIFRIDGLRLGTRWGGQPIIGDSVIVGFGSYDNTINALGKGPSATTVSTPDASIPLNNKVLIKGTVMDVSPGTAYPEQAMKFPNGVPAMSDADMSEWMLYVYKGRPMPAMASGVSVKLEAVDPNMNYQNIGIATSDMYGNYGFEYEPEVEGQYMIIATFEGSGAYYGSTTTTYLTVGEALTPSTPITPEEPVTPFITTEIAIILAVVAAVVIGIVAFWALKRQK